MIPMTYVTFGLFFVVFLFCLRHHPLKPAYEICHWFYRVILTFTHKHKTQILKLNRTKDAF